MRECPCCGYQLECDVDRGYRLYPSIIGYKTKKGNDYAGAKLYFCSEECKKKFRDKEYDQ